jgi:N-acetyl-alpha-D-glucosaminyl L-malate synthase BshA
MNIGIMCHASFGGSARIATELAAELARRRHTVHLFTRTTPFGRWDQASRVRLHRAVVDGESHIHPAMLYTDWPEGECEAFVSQILHVIATEGLDVLHFHYAVPFAFLTQEVKRRLGRTAPVLIGTLHGTDVSSYGRDPVKGHALAAALRNLDALTTVSVSHARLASQVFGLSTCPEVIPNFVDLSRFRPQTHSRLDPNMLSRVGSSGCKAKIIHVSNFRPVKDPQSAARIFLGIREKIEVEFWLVGDGPEMGASKTIFTQNGLEQDVRFWGLRRDVAPILAQAHLLLMTSLSESFCLAALEALACGLPVLSTDVGGLAEVVVDGLTGLLFPVGDHALAVDLAVGLLSDPTRYRAMGEAAAIYARRFGQKRIVTAYEKLYHRLRRNRSHGEPQPEVRLEGEI